VAARFVYDLSVLPAEPLLTENLSKFQVPWAIYAGRNNLTRVALFRMPQFYDPAWTPFRSLVRGELDSDIALGQLPPVSVVLPDSDDPATSESPQVPFGSGVPFVAGVIDAITHSQYNDDTLVLLTYLTAGGYSDHVPPPGPRSRDIDASRGDATGAAIHYGPRVPLLALGKFAWPAQVSHIQLELSSITTFIEWNWLYGVALKTVAVAGDARRFRDTVANNLGSLLKANANVPAGAP
jgi:phospholipase C